MIGLEDFRDRMKAEIEKTKQMKSVQVSGRNLDDALRQASLELGLPLRVLEYEVLDRGRPGLLGIKNAPCRIIAYESVAQQMEKEETSLEEELDLKSYEEEEVPHSTDTNGRLSVRLASDGVWVKVFPAVGEGIPVSVGDVIGRLQERGVLDADKSIISVIVQQADMMWVKVAEYDYNPANDALLSLEVTDENMKAYIKAQEPGPGGTDLTADAIRGFLSNNTIVYGILEEALQEFEDFPEYNVPFLVAEGTEPVHGADAKVLYNFETEPDKVHIQEREDGSVDFKELNKFQNVVKGQPLARKVSPEPGKDGRTVYGRYIPAKDGNDLEIGLGKNVTISDNGATVVATASGHVMLKNGKITVDTVLTIPGNVDSKTGNVNALGSVVIKGNVEDGFSVTAQGKIEVSGFVGKANLNAGGDIIVSRGINGGEGDEFGHITAGKSIWSSFIQNATAEAGEFVIVSAGIVNSDVVAQKKVLCKGKRAKIVGGHVRAAEEVNAVILGSAGGSETLVEVGFDPKAKEEMEALNERRKAIEAERDNVDRNLQGLKRQVRMQRRRLSKEKEQLFEELRIQHNELHKKLQAVDEEIEKKQDYLDSLLVHGKVSAAKKVLAGVILRIRDVEYVVKDPYESPVTFILEDDYIRTVKFQDIEEDLTRR
ncbi:MAG: FapA family protein [Spirochaetaceae bacterium]|nr:FapA family protein [Spirochaetaceae bacterium]